MDGKLVCTFEAINQHQNNIFGKKKSFLFLKYAFRTKRFPYTYTVVLRISCAGGGVFDNVCTWICPRKMLIFSPPIFGPVYHPPSIYQFP